MVLGGRAAVRNVKVCSVFIRDGSITTLESSFLPPLSMVFQMETTKPNNSTAGKR